MPHHQRGLMRRKCWRCQQHNFLESGGDAVGVVCELQKKWGWTLITPGTTHCPLTNKGGKFILIRVVPTEGRQKYKRPFGSATHEKGGFPTPPPVRRITPEGVSSCWNAIVHAAIRRSAH